MGVHVTNDDACQQSMAPFFQGLLSKEFKFRSKPFVFLNQIIKGLGNKRMRKGWKKFFVPRIFGSKSKLKIKVKKHIGGKLKIKGKKGKKSKKGLKLKIKGKKGKKSK